MSGAELKVRRMKVRVSRLELAGEMGVGHNLLQRVEDGWQEMPAGFSERFLLALAAVTGRRHESVLAARQPEAVG